MIKEIDNYFINILFFAVDKEKRLKSDFYKIT